MIASSPLPFQDGGDLLYSKEYNTPSWEDETLTVTRREERPGKRTCTIPAFWREAPLGSSDAQEESPPRQLLHNEPEPTESGYDEATPPDPLASPEIGSSKFLVNRLEIRGDLPLF
jgi:hypothetical protein